MSIKYFLLVCLFIYLLGEGGGGGSVCVGVFFFVLFFFTFFYSLAQAVSLFFTGGKMFHLSEGV